MGLRKQNKVTLKSVKVSGNKAGGGGGTITIPTSFKPTHAYVKGYNASNETLALRTESGSIKQTSNLGNPTGTMGYVYGANLTDNALTFNVQNNGNDGFAVYSAEVYGV